MRALYFAGSCILSLRYCHTTLRDDTLKRPLTTVFVWDLHYRSCIYSALFGRLELVLGLDHTTRSGDQIRVLAYS